MNIYSITSFRKPFPTDLNQTASDTDEVNDLLFEPVKSINWIEYPYKPDVHFKMIRFNNGLFIRFKVEESEVKATIILDNGSVYNDSCVEFFIDPSGDGSYYNFEFNAIGTMLLGYGFQRNNRILAPENILKTVSRFTTLGKDPIHKLNGGFWELTAFIPYSAFFMHQINSLEGLELKGNIYKCGNLLKVPHYVTWNPVLSERPDFHRPEYFGKFKIL